MQREHSMEELYDLEQSMSEEEPENGIWSEFAEEGLNE